MDRAPAAALPKQKRLSIEEKLSICKRYSKKVSVKILAADFQVNRQAIEYVVKNRVKYETAAEGGISGIRKSLKTTNAMDVDEILFQWFINQREAKKEVNGSILRPKLVELTEDFIPTNPKRSQLVLHGSSVFVPGILYPSRSFLVRLRPAQTTRNGSISSIATYCRCTIPETCSMPTRLRSCGEHAVAFRLCCQENTLRKKGLQRSNHGSGSSQHDRDGEAAAVNHRQEQKSKMLHTEGRPKSEDASQCQLHSQRQGVDEQAHMGRLVEQLERRYEAPEKKNPSGGGQLQCT